MVYSMFTKEGRFAQYISGPFAVVIAPTLADWDGFHYEGEYDDSYYFFDGEPTKRPDLPIAVNGLTIENVPAGSTITIENEEYLVEETTDVELEFNLPGIYIVTVSCWPYLDKEFEIENSP